MKRTSGASIYHWNGGAWELTTASGGPFGQVWGLDRNTLWAVSSSGYILHFRPESAMRSADQ